MNKVNTSVIEVGVPSKVLVKDLLETDDTREEVCAHCKGTSIEPTPAVNPYGLDDDKHNPKLALQYRQESFTFCQHCYNGVVKVCKHCGKIIERGSLYCDCDATKQIMNEKAIAKVAEVRQRAKRREDSRSALDEMGMLCSEYLPYNEGYFSSWEEFFQEFKVPEGADRPEYVNGTYVTYLAINMDNVIENECEELCEAAYDNINDGDIKDISDTVDTWCEAHKSDTATYTVDDNILVRIPWEDYHENI